MKPIAEQMIVATRALVMLTGILTSTLSAQDGRKEQLTFEEYSEEVMDTGDEYLSSLEEWRDMIDQWLENPVCLNNQEADWLTEYKLISQYQLSKLKEYRLMYGDLLSVHELGLIEGWDFQTVLKVTPLVIASLPAELRSFRKFTARSFRQSLVLKTAINTSTGKGYDKVPAEDGSAITGPVYTGPPFRSSLRYDLSWRDKAMIGIRMEKDPGEPFLVTTGSWFGKYKSTDLFSGFLQLKNIGPVQSIILGDYRLSFGYGINLAGGLTGIRGRSGVSGMSDRIRPQTSLSESGYYRGLAVASSFGKFSITGFGSYQAIDANSLTLDSLTGRALSFSSADKSGLHRTLSEISSKQAVNEFVAGGWAVFRNEWLKAGLIAVYNRFDAAMTGNNRPYALYDFKGRENLVSGISMSAWVAKLTFFGEASVSRNAGKAAMAGLQWIPVPGALIYLTYRYFDIKYQNLYGSGYSSAGSNSNEKGLLFGTRIEFPYKWILEFNADLSRSPWVSYNVKAPSEQSNIKLQLEKSWNKTVLLLFSFRYDQETIDNKDNSEFITHPGTLSSCRFRLEGRIGVHENIALKSRIEYHLAGEHEPGMLVFQDIEVYQGWKELKFWIRACFFDANDFENNISAYERDVLYGFTSFMHYGKGVRGILMASVSPAAWLDIWVRFATVWYTNKYIGSGWDETGKRRQNEISLQVRVRTPR